MKILLIEICNFTDFPTGGQLSFARSMMKAYGNDLVLAGCSTDDTPTGQWCKKEIDGVCYDFYSVARFSKSGRKPLIPNRIKAFVQLKRHIRDILSHDFDKVFIQSPEVLFCIPDDVLPKTAIDMPGLSNPLSISRYGWAKMFAGLFDKLYFKKLGGIGHIWATGNEDEVKALIQRSRGRLDRRELTILPTRYDEDVFHPMDREQCRMEIGFPEGKKLFVTVGRLNKKKGWQLMIDAFSILAKDSGCTLAFIGDGEDEMEIRQYISGKGLGEEDVILVGRRCAQEIAVCLNAADVFVMGSEKEGWSTTLVEACACGTPCAVTDFSSAREMVQNGENGYVCDGREPLALASAMTGALQLDRETVIAYDKRFEELAARRLKDIFNARFSSSVIICGIVRNAGKGLKKNIPVINSLCDHFGDYKIVMFENNSKDDTKVLLREWQKDRGEEHVFISIEDIPNPLVIPSGGSSSANPFYSRGRIGKMVGLRNQYMDFIAEKGWTADYLIVVDMDVAEIRLEGVLDSLKHGHDWDAVTAYGYSLSPKLKRRYHDTYALTEYGCQNIPQTESKILELADTYADVNKGSEWKRVFSAFGGLAIYRFAAVQGLRYQLLPNADPRVEVHCEHFSLFTQMAERGFDKSYINPKMVIHYQKTTPRIIINSLARKLKKS